MLSEVVTNFHNSQEEISLTVCPQNMVVTNYVDEDQGTLVYISSYSRSSLEKRLKVRSHG